MKASHRALATSLVNQLIPATESMPSVSSVLFEKGALARVDSVRPDLVARFLEAISQAQVKGWSDPHQIRSDDPDAFRAIAETICGAYLTDPDVARSLRYPGRRALEVSALDAETATVARLAEPVRAAGHAKWRLIPATPTSPTPERN